MPASQLSDGLLYILYSACCCRYLTFYSYTLQLLQLVAASFSHIVRVIVARELPLICHPFCCLKHNSEEMHGVQGERRYAWVEETADDLSCAVFGLANVVCDSLCSFCVQTVSAMQENRLKAF